MEQACLFRTLYTKYHEHHLILSKYIYTILLSCQNPNLRYPVILSKKVKLSCQNILTKPKFNRIIHGFEYDCLGV
jgi:hypothetical protein